MLFYAVPGIGQVRFFTEYGINFFSLEELNSQHMNQINANLVRNGYSTTNTNSFLNTDFLGGGIQYTIEHLVIGATVNGFTASSKFTASPYSSDGSIPAASQIKSVSYEFSATEFAGFIGYDAFPGKIFSFNARLYIGYELLDFSYLAQKTRLYPKTLFEASTGSPIVKFSSGVTLNLYNFSLHFNAGYRKSNYNELIGDLDEDNSKFRNVPFKSPVDEAISFDFSGVIFSFELGYNL
jgi:hypothetical protein